MIRPSSPLTMLLSRHTRRREFISLLAGAAAWPLAPRPALASEASGQRSDSKVQQPALPVIGYLGPTTAGADAVLRQGIGSSVASRMPSERMRGLHQGLKEAGYVVGENVAIIPLGRRQIRPIASA